MIETALNAICKTASSKFSPVLLQKLFKHIFQQKTQLQKEINNIEDYEKVVFVTDLFELYLSSLDHLVKGKPKDTQEYHMEIVKFASQMVEFDPNSNVKFVQDEQKMESIYLFN